MGLRARHAALTAVPALVLAACSGGAPATEAPKATATGTDKPAATQTAQATETPAPTLNIGTPKIEFTPGSVVIPLSEALDPKQWPKRQITNAQLEAAINSVTTLDDTTRKNLPNKLKLCEEGINGNHSTPARLGMCEALAVGILRAWNDGDPNAPQAFAVFEAYMVSPNGGFAVDFKPQVDDHFRELLTSYRIPFT